MNLVQLSHPQLGRRVACVKESRLVLLDRVPSVYELAKSAIAGNKSLSDVADAARSQESLEYDAVYSGRSEWQLLPAFDHPTDPLHCFVTGTGLTHMASAKNREKMHEAQAAGNITDSMRMYQWGVEGGRPAPGQIGVQPEWFYKGTGEVLKGHNEPLVRPAFANDGGEEPEVAAAYLIDHDGTPWRIGFAAGNEFSDHVMEKKNYLYLAHSKLRQCAFGPELVPGNAFGSLTGKVSVTRNGKPLWSSEIQSGEEHMAHTLANLEYHHFKYREHRIPGTVHIHFFGAAAFSFGAQVQLEDGDVMEVAWNGLGRPLRNPLKIEAGAAPYVAVKALA